MKNKIKLLKRLHKSAAAAAKLFQSCPTLCDPIDGSPPGTPVPGILQARTLEWVAIAFSSIRVQKEQLYEADMVLIFKEGSVYGGLKQILESR